MLLSIIVPAFNEELYLPQSLSSLQRAAAECRCSIELIVVDNASTDRTAEIARHPAQGLFVSRSIISPAFADTTVPHEFLDKVHEAMTDPLCLGGSADIVHHVRSKILQAYLAAWRWTGFKLGMAQGAAQYSSGHFEKIRQLGRTGMSTRPDSSDRNSRSHNLKITCNRITRFNLCRLFHHSGTPPERPRPLN